MNDELIVRVLSGAAAPEEVAALRRWRREAPSHDRYFREVRHVWAVTAPPPPRPVAAAAITAAVVEAARRADVEAPREGLAARGASRQGPGWASRRWIALAAALAGVVLGVGYRATRGVGEGSPTWEAGTSASLTVTLPDGSLVRVAPGGRLRAVEAAGERRYALEGGAFFAVAHDVRRPFVVEAGAAVVRVVGTRFEIDRTDAAVTAAVVDGRVVVSGPGGTAEVEGGALALLDGKGVPVVERPPDIFARLHRSEDALLFQATPLDRVARDVARRFGRPVTVEGAALRSRTVTGWFGPEGFEEVVGALCSVVGANCTVDDASATLRSR